MALPILSSFLLLFLKSKDPFCLLAYIVSKNSVASLRKDRRQKERPNEDSQHDSLTRLGCGRR
jgi:hypothetical protein